MDLNDMKARWSVLNECLAKNEILNKRVVKELIMVKTKSAYDTIYHSELNGLYLILFIGLILFPGTKLLGVPMKWTSFILLEVIMFLAMLIQLYLIFGLFQFKLNYKPVNELTRTLLRYKKIYWYNKRWGTFLGIGSVGTCMFIENTCTNVSAMMTTLFMFVVAGGFTFVKMKRHEEKIKEVEEGLLELEELENEQDRETIV